MQMNNNNNKFENIKRILHLLFESIYFVFACTIHEHDTMFLALVCV